MSSSFSDLSKNQPISILLKNEIIHNELLSKQQTIIRYIGLQLDEGNFDKISCGEIDLPDENNKEYGKVRTEISEINKYLKNSDEDTEKTNSNEDLKRKMLKDISKMIRSEVKGIVDKKIDIDSKQISSVSASSLKPKVISNQR